MKKEVPWGAWPGRCRPDATKDGGLASMCPTARLCAQIDTVLNLYILVDSAMYCSIVARKHKSQQCVDFPRPQRSSDHRDKARPTQRTRRHGVYKM